MGRIYKIMILLLLLTSCLQEEQFNLDKQGEPLLSLGAEINQVAVTRVNDDGFCDGDAMGIYVVDYSGDQAGELKTSGNRANNVRYIYDEANNRWQGDYDVYYKDHKTPVDIYAYYPVGSPDNTSNYSFTVQQNQSVEGGNGELGGYEASDFLWGKATKVSPTDSRVMIKLNHIMSCVRVELVEGEGFSAGEWSNLEKNIVLKSLRRGSSIDLSTGTVSAAGEMESAGTVPYRKGDSFRAIVVPQTVPGNAELFSISVGTVPYTFSREDSMEYISGKMHKFTIKVNRKGHEGSYEFALVGESITAWENDDVSHDATMREYIVVNSTAGGLREAIIALGKDFRQLQNLKVTGGMNEEDFYFMRDSMSSLSYLNIKSAEIEPEERHEIYMEQEWRAFENVRSIPNDALSGKMSLKKVVFPDKLDIIGSGSFSGTSLTGSLLIPEGVFLIGGNAFGSCPCLNGNVSFPSTLKYILYSAFSNSGLCASLKFPESLELIDGCAFYLCDGLSGELVLPERLRKIGEDAFFRCGFTGGLVIPESISVIENGTFSECCFDGILSLPENLKEIGQDAFKWCRFTGPLMLPANLKFIGSNAFEGNLFFGDLVLPEKLQMVGTGAFYNNQYISGVVSIPASLESVPKSLFESCQQIKGVRLHKDINYIGEAAFANCFQMNVIVSEADIPPSVGNRAFDGVPKDNFTVEVPEKSVVSYANALGWQDFKRISAHHELVCRPAFASAINSETKRRLVLNAEGEWEVVSIPEWCSLSRMEGRNKTELILTIQQMPAGSAIRTGEVVFKLKNKDYTHTCTVSQYDYQYGEDEVITLQKASKGNTGGVNLVFIGDGYDGKDISEGLYLQDVQMQVENFFAIHPYKAYRDYFNVYTAIAVSPESGTGTVNTINYNKFETTYTGGSGLKCNNEAVFQYVLDMKTPVTEENLNEALIVLLPNASDYGGIAYMWEDGSAIAICPKSNMGYPYDTRGILQHEAGGHGFGKLGDEYIYYNMFAPECKTAVILHYHTFGWYENLSLTGKMHDTPWAHLIFNENYSDIVDVFEGGFEFSRGVYRSEYTSCMNNNIAYFSTISRESMVKRIKRYAGEEYSFEEFVANDSRESGTVTKSGTDFVPGISQIQSHCAPVVYSGSPLRTNKN